jgi:hypothetical protein
MAESAKRSVRGAKTLARKSNFNAWSKAFLDKLAETSNVTAAAAAAKIVTSTAYDAKRTKPEFNRKWQRALCEGYELLEMELLNRLRTGEIKNSLAKKGVRLRQCDGVPPADRPPRRSRTAACGSRQ